MGGKALGGNKITNEEAVGLFEKIFIQNDLGSKTSKILLCGSARRGKPTCGDLDIVFIDTGENESLLKEWLVDNYGVKKNENVALCNGGHSEQWRCSDMHLVMEMFKVSYEFC